jgi:quercetin dioxygenase-like cupin family protein
MPIIRAADARRSETPNAAMTTLASPSQGGAGHAVWRVEMWPGQAGPLHAFDVEQVWTALDGGATVLLDGAEHALGPGDTAVIPGAMARRVVAGDAGFTAIVSSAAGARARLSDGTDKGVPPWIA